MPDATGVPGVAVVVGPAAAPRTIWLTLPVYCLADRRSPKRLAQAELVGTTFLYAGQARRALLAYRHRGTAAAHVDRDGRLKPWPVFSVADLDRLSIVAIGRLQLRWLALEPDREVKAAEAFIDLVAWLRQRRPWSDALAAFTAASGFGTPEALLATVST